MLEGAQGQWLLIPVHLYRTIREALPGDGDICSLSPPLLQSAVNTDTIAIEPFATYIFINILFTTHTPHNSAHNDRITSGW